jgi:hypothetical protein
MIWREAGLPRFNRQGRDTKYIRSSCAIIESGKVKDARDMLN